MEFDDVINEHLELRRRNAGLEQSLPLEHYRAELATRNQPPRDRRTEAAADETQDFSPGWLVPSEREPNRDADSSRLWDVPPLFDWDK